MKPGSEPGSGEAAIRAPDEAVLVTAGAGLETAGLVEAASLWGNAGSTGARKPGAAAPGASRGWRWSRATRRRPSAGSARRRDAARSGPSLAAAAKAPRRGAASAAQDPRDLVAEGEEAPAAGWPSRPRGE